MAASCITRYYHGASPGTASSDVTGATVRHQLADLDTQTATYPIPLPTSGLSFGYRKSSKVDFTSSPVTQITNLRWFLNTLPGTGINFFARVQSTGLYIFATSSDVNGITGFTDTAPNQSANNAANYISSAPLTVNSGTVISNPNTGEGTQVFVETQLAILSTYAGGPGPVSSFQLAYRYSES